MSFGHPLASVDEEKGSNGVDLDRTAGQGVDGRRSAVEGFFPSKKGAWSNMQLFKLLLVISDCLLIGLQPILVHMSQVDGKYTYNLIGVNLMMELFKLAFAVCLLVVSSKSGKGSVLFVDFRAQFKANVPLIVPAFLYAINSYVKFSLLLYFSPTSAKMISNLKILTIAILLKLVMKRSFSILQYEALYLLVAGISINQLSNGCEKADGVKGGLSAPAIMFTVLSLTVPAAASVFNEFSYKKNFQAHIHLQNFYLYLYGTLFNLLGWAVYTGIHGIQEGKQIFVGSTRLTVLLTINGALQGILSSFFYKFADTILKKYSSAVATLFTGLLSFALLNSKLTLNFMIGVSVVLISMHQFFSGSLGSSKLTRTGEPDRLYASPSLNHIGRDFSSLKYG